jgi:hypothetical protein
VRIGWVCTIVIWIIAVCAIWAFWIIAGAGPLGLVLLPAPGGFLALTLLRHTIVAGEMRISEGDS